MSSQAGIFFYCSKGTKVTKRFLGFPNQFETKVTFLLSWQTDCSQHTKSRRPPRWRWAKKLQLAQSTEHRAADGSIGNKLNYSFIKTTAIAHNRTQGLEISLYYYIKKKKIKLELLLLTGLTLHTVTKARHALHILKSFHRKCEVCSSSCSSTTDGWVFSPVSLGVKREPNSYVMWSLIVANWHHPPTIKYSQLCVQDIEGAFFSFTLSRWLSKANKSSFSTSKVLWHYAAK